MVRVDLAYRWVIALMLPAILAGPGATFARAQDFPGSTEVGAAPEVGVGSPAATVPEPAPGVYPGTTPAAIPGTPADSVGPQPGFEAAPRPAMEPEFGSPGGLPTNPLQNERYLPAAAGRVAGPGESAPPESADLREGMADQQGPAFLRRPLESGPQPAQPAEEGLETEPLLETPMYQPLGFAGPSGIVPRETQQSGHFFPIEDRWRLGLPPWDRQDKGHPPLDDYPFVMGHWYDPYNLNVLKGDYPIIGQHTFLNVTGSTQLFAEARMVPIGTTPFESTSRPGQFEFFGRPSQGFYNQLFSLSFDLFHGDASFKQPDWRVVVTPVFDVNYIAVNELAVVNPDVRKGTTRGRTWLTAEEYFVESKLTDTSPYYDIISARVGSQPFVSDFRGFIFDDTNRAVRLFGTNFSNRDQFNLIYFRQAEKDTDSELNTMSDRGQDVFIANYYRQDFLFPGYTTELSLHYNHDPKSMHFDKDSFLVRPDPTGVFQPHELDVFYLGWAGDGHIDRYNITHAFYWALGRDSQNPLSGTEEDINAQMAAIELSYDRDWVRFRTSFFWASGDHDINNHHATGFDAIFDNPNFAGGQFSYWQRQAIRLFGVNLTNRGSLLPDLRSSKIEGQSNFVNPGVVLGNAGVDFELTPKLRMINNVNFLWFDTTNVLEQYTFDGNIHKFIGVDLSSGFEYRPLLSNNIIMTFGVSSLLPGRGFRDLYDQFNNDVSPMFAAFADVRLVF